MRPCTPTIWAPSATGRQYRPRRRPKRARRQAQIGAGTGTPTPVRAKGHCTGARQSDFFSWTVHGPFSFCQEQKENGGWNAPAIIMSDFPRPMGRTPRAIQR